MLSQLSFQIWFAIPCGLTRRWLRRREVIGGEPVEQPRDGAVDRVADLGLEARSRLDRLHRHADEMRRRVDGSVIREPQLCIGLRPPDHVRDPSRLLLVPGVVPLALVAREVEDRRFAQERKEVADEERGDERIAPVDDLEEAQRRLAGVSVGRARRNQRSVPPDLLRPLDAGQLAELVKRIRRCRGVDDLELLHALEPLSRKQRQFRENACSPRSIGITWR